MSGMKRVGNPLSAAIVGLIIAGMGLYLVVVGTDGAPVTYGYIMISLGLLGAVANMALRRHFQRQDRPRDERGR